MIATGVLWGTIGPSVEQLKRHGGLANVDIAFWRAVVASLAVTAFAITAARRRRNRHDAIAAGERRTRPSRRNIGVGLLCGTSTVASQICYFAALGQIGIGPATLVALGLGPLLVAIGEATFLGRRPSPRLLGVVAVSVIGTVLLVGGAHSTAPDGGNVLLGLLLAAGSAATYATVVLTSGAASRALGAAGLNLLVFVGSALSLTPVIVISGLSVPDDAQAIAVTVYLGLIASALAYGLYFLAARTLKSTVISVLALLEPLTAAILAWVIFGQSLSAIAIAGGALLLGGVIALSGQDDLVAEAAPIGAAIPETAD
jgi:DME family drug/metabolite transporter